MTFFKASINDGYKLGLYTQASNDRPCNYRTSRSSELQNPFFLRRNVSAEAKKDSGITYSTDTKQGIEERNKANTKTKLGSYFPTFKTGKSSVTY